MKKFQGSWIVYCVASACQAAVTQKALLYKTWIIVNSALACMLIPVTFHSKTSTEKRINMTKKEGQREFKYTRIGERLKIWHL